MDSTAVLRLTVMICHRVREKEEKEDHTRSKWKRHMVQKSRGRMAVDVMVIFCEGGDAFF